MTPNELRAAVVAQAKAWLGRHEADGSHREIIDLYNRYRKPGDYCMTYSDPWCAAYVSAVGMAVSVANALPGKPYELIPSSAACDPMIAQYKALGRWVEDDAYLPSPGDVIFYDWQDSGVGDNTGSTDHVGIVVAVSGSTITVIEGNKSDAVGYRTMRQNGTYIRGYGLPDYAKYASEAPDGQCEIVVPDDGEGTDVPTTPAPDTNVGGKKVFTIELHYLCKGDKGEDVRAMQGALIARGCSCGKWGADGDFGNDTYAALRAFQNRNGLKMDGEYGPLTASKLLGVT